MLASTDARPAGPARNLITMDEAAARLGVHAATIRNYISRGDLAAYRLAGARLLRVDAADVDALARPVSTGASIAARIEALVAAAPPLTGEQMDRIGRLLRAAHATAENSNAPQAVAS